MRRAGRLDAVQPELIRAIESAFWSAQSLASLGGGVPDLLVGGQAPCWRCRALNKTNLLIEAKAKDGTLTPDQLVWHLEWRGQIAIARNVDEVLRILRIGR